MNDFKHNIQEWVKLDNMILEYNNKIRNIKTQKVKLTESLYKQAQYLDVLDTNICISDGKIKFQTLKQTKALTLHFIEQCLTDCLSSPSTVQKIMEHIKESRQFKYRDDIKRLTYKNNLNT